ncbi:MAG: PP2C family serine/threonine-protein phosphatase [Ilumatobacteraceae bacterium]
MATLRWGTATDPGRIRPDNEDNLLAGPLIFAVADGRGGHRAGEVASAIAVDLLRDRLGAPGADLDAVIAAISEANGNIFREANGNPDQQGMGTTITALVVIADRSDRPEDTATAAAKASTTDADTATGTDSGTGTSAEPPPATPAGEQLALVNVGDSRTYLLRHGRLRRVTIDHSYVQELVATGNITDDEARTHPRRNIVTRALGIDPSVRIDAWTLPLVRGDRFLLCSDGLVDEVVDDEIVAVLTRLADPQAAADELVATANAQGGRDNITVVVVDVVEGVDPPDPDSELDLEPAWDDTDDGTWSVDDPDAAATEFQDLAALVSGDELDPAAAGSTTDGTTAAAAVNAVAAPGAVSTDPVRADTDRVPPGAATPGRRRKRRLGGFLAVVGVLAVLVLALVIASAWARRGFFVAFDDADVVVVYRGQTDGFLWFDPTVDAPSQLTRDALDEASIERVEREPRFDSRKAAERFVVEQLETTTTTSTTTTTTTTTVPPTTTSPTTTAP